MKLIWHLCKKDFVHLRLALGLWVLLLGSELFFNQRLLSPAGTDGEWFDRAILAANLFALISVAVSYLMMASLVLEDPPVGSRMFWATRPISGSHLLGAKVLGILLAFGALPILVRLPWWLYCGYDAADLGRAALQSLSAVGITALAAVVLAALSGNSSRFLLYSLLLLVAFPMASVWIASRAGPAPGSNLLASRFFLSVLLVAAGGLAAAVSQFLTRRIIPSVAILSAGVALAAVCLLTWPWRLNQLWPDQPSLQAGAEPIAAEILDVGLFPSRNRASPEQINVTFTLRLHSLPADRNLLSGAADVELRWPDGFVVRQTDLKVSPHLSGDRQALQQVLALPSVRPDIETVAKLAKLQAERLRQQPRAARPRTRPRGLAADEIGAVFHLPVPPEVAARIKAEPPACTLSARLVLGRPEVLFELPMRQGAVQSGRGARLHILDLGKDSRSADAPDDEASDKWTLTLVTAAAPQVKPVIYRVDRERGQLEGIKNGASALYPLWLGPHIGRDATRLTIPRIWRTDRWLDEPDWLSAQSLVAVTFHEEPGFSCTLHADRLPLQPASE